MATRYRLRNSSGEAIKPLFNDDSRSVSIFCASRETLFHELRRLIRDEIGVPSLISRGARVLHAGRVTFKGVTLLILGASGGGKTTAVLSLLTADAGARYGAAERTLAWVDSNRVMALGIPESVTVFPGTLQQVPEFLRFAASADAADLWTPARKTRLQLTDILSASGRPAIQREVPVDLIIEVQYEADLKDAARSGQPGWGGARKVPAGNCMSCSNVRREWRCTRCAGHPSTRFDPQSSMWSPERSSTTEHSSKRRCACKDLDSGAFVRERRGSVWIGLTGNTQLTFYGGSS